MAVVSVNKKKWGVKHTSYVSSQMCGRTTEIAAVGAWVQPGPGIQNGHDDVVVSFSCTLHAISPISLSCFDMSFGLFQFLDFAIAIGIGHVCSKLYYVGA